ncbi:MAG: type I 3-dehydroquinate dehydratase, partial [Thermoplasmatota archaeon]
MQIDPVTEIEMVSQNYNGLESFISGEDDYRKGITRETEGNAMVDTLPEWAVVVINAPSVGSIRKQFNTSLAKGMRLVEIRLDCLSPRETPESYARMGVNLMQLATFSKKYAMISLRRETDGGQVPQRQLPEDKRLDHLTMAIKHGFNWIDLEEDIAQEKLKDLSDLARKYGSKVMITRILHENEEWSPPGSGILEMGDAYRVITAVNSSADMSRWFRTISSVRSTVDNRPTMVQPIGSFGQLLNSLTPFVGNRFNFVGCSESGSVTADTRWSFPPMGDAIADWKHLGFIGEGGNRKWSLKDLEFNENTSIYVVLGKPVTESLETIVNNVAFRGSDINALCLPVTCSQENLDQCIQMIRKMPIMGANVTMPVKRAAAQKMDWLDRISQKVGSISTVIKKDNRLYGYNTNGMGIADVVRSSLPEEGGRILILGTGGSGRAAAYELKGRGYKTFLSGSNADLCRRLVSDLGGGIGSIDFKAVGRMRGKIDVLINATPEGMVGVSKTTNGYMGVAEIARIVEPSIGIDLIYSPPWTPFLASVES